MKLRLKNEFGIPINLLMADSITLYYPREDGSWLQKRDVTILDAENGILDVKPTNFEVQALKMGQAQDFFAKVVVGDETLTIKFHKGLDVELKDERKIINEKSTSPVQNL